MAKNNLRKKLTRQEQRDLDVEVSFLAGVVRRDPDFTEALQILGDAYTRRGNFADGLTIDERLAKLCPDNCIVHYNLACSYSLTEQCEEGIVALERALALGYRDFGWLTTDPDLKNLRRHALFRKIRARVRSLRVKAR